MEPQKSLEWILRECVAGNTNAFRLLFEQTRGDLFRFIRSRASGRDDALDVLQETYCDLWKSLKGRNFTYASDAEFKGFLFLIARRKIARLYRFSRPVFSIEEMSDTISTKTNEIDAGETAILMNAVGKLNAEDQEVIRLHYFAGLGFKEIGSLLDKGEGAVKTRHHRAIMKLKEMLGYEKQP